jgi:hypothetical protein
MILLVLLSLLVAFIVGFFVIRIIEPGWTLPSRAASFAWFITAGMGVGILSCFFFVWTLLFGSSGYCLGEVALLSSCAVVLLLKRKTDEKYIATELYTVPVHISYLPQSLAICFCVALAGAATTLIMLSLEMPHGGWDAWAIWNLRARFLFRGGEMWRQAFSPLLVWSHPDYPLLLPGSIVRLWKYAGEETLLAPRLMSWLFTSATIGLAAFSICALRGRSQGYLAGLVLAGTSFFVAEGALQYADVPIAFYFLTTLVLLSSQRTASPNGNLALLAGMAAGFSAWTKNEGWAFVLAIVVGRFLAALYSRTLTLYAREILYFTAGLLPVLIIIVYFKFALAPPNDLFNDQGLRVSFGRFLDFSRYLTIAKAFWDAWIGLPVMVLLFYSLCLGITGDTKNLSEGVSLTIVLSLLLLGYFLVYVASPHDLSWHLKTSTGRLLVQLWPSVVFTYFLIVRNVEEAIFAKETAQSAGSR